MDSFHLSLLFQVLPSKHVFPVPAVKPEYITLPISALTAAISLDKVKKKPFLKCLILLGNWCLNI